MQPTNPVDESQLRQDYDEHDTPSASRPGYLTRYDDEIFGTMLVLATNPNKAVSNPTGDASLDGARWNDEARNEYPNRPCWNCVPVNDPRSLLWIGKNSGNNIALQGLTLEPQFKMQMNGISLWHPSDPELMVYMKDSGEVGFCNPRTGERTVKLTLGDDYKDFGISNPDTPWSSSDRSLSETGGLWTAVIARRRSDSKKVAFAINIDTGQKGYEIELDDVFVDPDRNTPDATIFADGSGIRFYGKIKGYSDSRGQAQSGYDAASGEKLWETFRYHEGHHGGHTMHDGVPCHAGIFKGDNTQSDQGTAILRDMRTGAYDVICDYWGSHVSAVNMLGMQHTCLISYQSPSKGNLQGEMVLAYKDGSQKILRCGHSRFIGTGGNYALETQATLSPCGTRMAFHTGWDRDSKPAYCYVVLLPLKDGEQVPEPQPPEETDYELMIGKSPDRSEPEVLGGQTVRQDIYVYTEPLDGSGVDEVVFSIDGAEVQKEKKAPHDLAGTAADDTSQPFNTMDLSDGDHIFSAVVTHDGGSTELSGVLKVENEEEPPVEPPEDEVTWEGEMISSDGQVIDLTGKTRR